MRLLIDWVERQFHQLGLADAHDLALDLVAAYQGMSLLTNAFRDPEIMTGKDAAWRPGSTRWPQPTQPKAQIQNTSLKLVLEPILEREFRYRPHGLARTGVRMTHRPRSTTTSAAANTRRLVCVCRSADR